MEKNCIFFVVEKLYFADFLGLDFKFKKKFELWLDLY